MAGAVNLFSTVDHFKHGITWRLRANLLIVENEIGTFAHFVIMMQTIFEW